MNGKALFYNEDYFERGIESGIGLYQNYRWMPELTMPLAMTIIDFLNIDRKKKILDFGCAKGFLVKAFRLLYRDARGVDISPYAISNADEKVKGFCTLKTVDWKMDGIVDICIAKDVFEHICESELEQEMENLRGFVKTIFVVVPLGDKFGKYVASANNLDISHVICKDEEWWDNFFLSNGWDVIDFRFRIDGIKDHYYGHSPRGHGFFTLENLGIRRL